MEKKKIDSLEKSTHKKICCRKKIILYIVSVILFVVGAVFSNLEWNYVASFIFIMHGVGLYFYFTGAQIIRENKGTGKIKFRRQTFFHSDVTLGKWWDLRAILALSWICTIGITCLKWSNYQVVWDVRTWISLGLFFYMFVIAYTVVYERKPNSKKINILDGNKKSKALQKRIRNEYRRKSPRKNIVRHSYSLEENIGIDNERLFKCIIILFMVTVGAFAAEALILGYIPMFATFTHAYNYFHISGVHYFTVSTIFVHPLSVLYLLNEKNIKRNRLTVLVFINIIALAVPILCLSKLQLALAIVFSVLVYLFVRGTDDIKKYYKIALPLCIIVAGLIIIMILRRNYEAGYLNKIFNMKNPDMPLIVQYVYTYIANNFENFNKTVYSITRHSYGLKSLFPVFALTGLKFVNFIGAMLDFESFTTVPELNTMTILCDAYYDFGIAGAGILGIVLGFISGGVGNKLISKGNMINYLLFAQFFVYIGLSFFNTWFSIPTTWFWFVITILIYFFCKQKKNK